MQFNNLDKLELSSLSPIRTYEYHELISSTSDRVRELFNEFFCCNTNRDVGETDRFPCLVVAGEQTSGRGRDGKSWWSGVGGLMLSFGLELGSNYFPIRREFLPDFSPVVGDVVIEVLQKYILDSDKIELHYPNDVYVNNKKIAGILIESPIPDFAIIGIGINVNNSAQNAPIELNQTITTLSDLTGTKTNLRKILLELVTTFFSREFLLQKR